MAEIKIEKKKAIWPWIIGIIILALLIYFLAFNDNKEGDLKENPVEELTMVNAVYPTETIFVTIA
ncbi:MAG: hypothetical protein H7X84_08105 [Verrucomicrobia bacterium]|nr:hypothetical protein [Prolixibacteraceae bacterium]